MPDWGKVKEKIQSSSELSSFKKKYLTRLVGYGIEFDNSGRTRTSELMFERITKQMKVKSNRYTKFTYQGNLTTPVKTT